MVVRGGGGAERASAHQSCGLINKRSAVDLLRKFHRSRQESITVGMLATTIYHNMARFRLRPQGLRRDQFPPWRVQSSDLSVYLNSSSGDRFTKLREQPRKVIKLVVRVQSARVRQYPDHGAAQPLILPANYSFGTPIRGPVRSDAEEGHTLRIVTEDFLLQNLRPMRILFV